MADAKVIKSSAPDREQPYYDATGKKVPGAYITYWYEDGTVEERFFYDEGAGPNGILVSRRYDPSIKQEQEKEERLAHPPRPQAALPATAEEREASQTPQERQAADIQNQLNQEKWNESVRENNERSWNEQHGNGPFTHAEVAVKQAKAEADKRAQEELQIRKDAEARQVEAQRQQAEAQKEANRLAQERLNEEIRQHNKPTLAAPPKENEHYTSVFDPQTGALTRVENPAYDAVKDQAEQERQRIMTEIAQRKMGLEEGIQQYTEWFNSNVKLPFMQADEARQQAQDRRQALDAEERRRQFASQFQLNKAELGQKGAAMMIQAEESLLPYRAGPTEAADMSSAINSLAAGGNPQGPSAAAGIHFQPSDFQFAAPDFKSIAKQGAEAAIGHLTDYRPSSDQFATASYGGIKFPDANTQAPSAIPAGGVYQAPTQVTMNSQ